MRYLTVLLKFLRSSQKLLLVEAVCWLGLSRLLILFARYPIQTRLLGQQELNGKDPELDCPQKAKQIGHIVRLAAKHLPWQCKCLAQAMAAQSMLRMRNISGIVFIGVNKTSNDYKAHAWLKVGDSYLTGGNGFTDYQVIDRYSTKFDIAQHTSKV
ncbi:lasso peptide biosynthesis B2 protein [Photobacterium kasasachensis]|uniref:lasso peptide biosynthesis B2 protein n=1 Tax=Photobacterium kasasachensis TaxID=2910240 RepID=UPI003D0AE68E